MVQIFNMRYLLFSLLLISAGSYAQCKSYLISARGDTINCVDRNDLKQGKWINKVAPLRGEPGYEEEGVYRDGKKEGIWRRYSSMGDLLAVERYRWGNKDGKSQYYSLAGLLREESWKAVNPQNPYDTIEVPDLKDPYKVEMRVIKIEGTSVKHGQWTYYDTESGLIVKTEKFFLDKIEDPFSKMTAGNSTAASDTTGKKPVAKVKPPEVQAFEKKNSGKKKVKYIDGSTVH